MLAMSFHVSELVCLIHGCILMHDANKRVTALTFTIETLNINETILALKEDITWNKLN